jgi:hypothetical protein
MARRLLDTQKFFMVASVVHLSVAKPDSDIGAAELPSTHLHRAVFKVF